MKKKHFVVAKRMHCTHSASKSKLVPVVVLNGDCCCDALWQCGAALKVEELSMLSSKLNYMKMKLSQQIPKFLELTDSDCLV